MPQLQTLVITDGAATPVAHTYLPREIKQPGNIGTVVESTGVPVGDPRVTVSLGQPTTSGRYKPSLRITIPVVQTETINGVGKPVVVRTAYVEVNCNFDGTSTEVERRDALALIRSALGADKTLVYNTLVKLEGVY